MGPCECIGRALQKDNWPKRSHRQQHLLMQWAHPSALAVPPRKIMSQNEAIGSSICQCNGPTRVHWQEPTKKQWAKAKQTGKVFPNSMGSAERSVRKYYKRKGPT